jgi:hypothetical protein
MYDYYGYALIIRLCTWWALKTSLLTRVELHGICPSLSQCKFQRRFILARAMICTSFPISIEKLCTFRRTHSIDYHMRGRYSCSSFGVFYDCNMGT